ncbi:hypothetical protein PIB30_064941 [Stylosanthes scabra]|uniref:Uncharacterized protein n=1 Tax=Stylosanthes scabra TaxID=79078 RepID=A0ABU6XKA8_9FABA|nr:hypothetical protein [Stylosanthes scabra]
MSVRQGKNNRIFGLYEESFHDFKGRYFKVFPVEGHHPFWLTLEGDGRFTSYWSFEAGPKYVPVSYKRLNAELTDVADILIFLFWKRLLKAKAILGNQLEAQKLIGKWTRKLENHGKQKTSAKGHAQAPVPHA